VACADFHYSAVSPVLSRIRVAKLESIGIDMSITCVSCVEKSCLICPVDALTVADDGTIAVDTDDCDGCEVCVDACPIGAVGFHDETPLFCDLCEGELSCVKACPSAALSFRETGGVSLQAWQNAAGNPATKRAAYALAMGEEVRREWLAGRRVDG